MPIVGGKPDAAALAAVENDPDCFTVYSRFPGGFTPQFGGLLTDHSVVAGLQHTSSSGFTWDASAGIGRSRIDQFIYDTVNASLGHETPTEFDPGSYDQYETNLNFDIAGPVGGRLHVAAGAEHRTERFTILPGEDASWRIGPYAEQGFSSGSNGFNGYPGGHDRREVGTVVGRVLRRRGAVRRRRRPLDPERGAALRALRRLRLHPEREGDGALPAGTGRRGKSRDLDRFRAPTPGQQNTFNVTTAFIDGELTNNGVVPSTWRVAFARGGRPLQPETSTNYSAGLVLETGTMAFTADYFRIDVADRLALSQETRLRPDEIEALLAEGIAEARNLPAFRFFLNDSSTRIQGSTFCGRGERRSPTSRRCGTTPEPT